MKTRVKEIALKTLFGMAGFMAALLIERFLVMFFM